MTHDIFVTVGSQMPFDRLIQAIDQWSTTVNAQSVRVFAQIGYGGYLPRAIESVPMLSPDSFREKVEAARLIVAHAGMGIVLTGLEFGKTLVLMPRKGTLRETRNDHQVATAKWLAQRPGIFIAQDEKQLPDTLNFALRQNRNEPGKISTYAPPSLIQAIQRFIADA